MPHLERRVLGELNCHIVTAEHPECLVVLCHGFGAPGDDLVPIGELLLQANPHFVDRVAFLFPEAPLSLEALGVPGGRAWWPLDMLKLQMAVESGDLRDLRNDAPELLPRSRQLLTSAMQVLQTELGLSMSHTIVGGFSQGSMLATDFALNASELPAGLVVWSGTLLNEQDWRAKADRLRELPIVQSHGTSDPILPFQAARWLESMFQAAQANVQFIEFSGGHTIPPPALEATAELIESCLRKHVRAE